MIDFCELHKIRLSTDFEVLKIVHCLVGVVLVSNLQTIELNGCCRQRGKNESLGEKEERVRARGGGGEKK